MNDVYQLKNIAYDLYIEVFLVSILKHFLVGFI